MKQTIIITSLLIFSFFLTSAQDFDFAFKAGGTGTDAATSVAVHPTDGSIYVCGHFSGTVNFVRKTGWQHRTSNGSKDIFVAKYSSDDRLLWVRAIGGSSEDKANDLAVDANGNVYVTGSFRSTVDFNPATNQTVDKTARGNTDIFLLKLSSAGLYNWVVTTGGTATTLEAGNGVAVDLDNNVYMTGAFEGFANFNPNGAARYQYINGNLNIFLAKYTSAGLLSWVKSIGDSSLDDMGGKSIAISTHDYIYVVGSFAGTAMFDPSTSYSILNSAGYQDGFVTCFYKTGTFSWAKRMGGAYSDYVHDITLDPHNNVGIAGRATGAVSYPGGGFTTYAGEQDAFFARMTSTGSFQWAKNIAGHGEWDDAYSVAMDGCGRMYVGGRFCSSADFDPSSSSTYRFAPACNGWYQNYAYFIACYETNGSYLWAETSGTGSAPGSGTSQVLGMALDACESLYMVGDFSTSQNFDISGGTHNLTPAGNKDAFVSKHFLPKIAVTNNGDTGKGSLRNAINCANSHVGPDEIVFNLKGSGPHTIYPHTTMTAVMDDHTSIDATTQPGYYLGQIVLDGSLLGPYSYGLRIDRCDNGTLVGMSIRNFSEDGIHGYYANNLTIKNCQIGGNGRDGMQLNYGTNALIQGNIVGLDELTTTPEPNGGCGINLYRSHNSRIGGSTTTLSNILSANMSSGLHLASDNTVVEGNYIGSNRSGYTNFGNMSHGVSVAGSSNRIGGGASYQGNLIVYNGSFGIRMQNNTAYNYNAFWLNSFYCNGNSAIEINNANEMVSPPQVTMATIPKISGTAKPLAYVDVYAADSSGCTGGVCQGRYWLGYVRADISGNWALNGSFAPNMSVMAMQTDVANNSSNFSGCVKTVSVPQTNNRQEAPPLEVEEITLFPNPTTNYFSIQSREKIEGVKIIDLKGRVLKKVNALEAGQRISVENLASGFYIAQVKTEAGEKAIRFCVKK